MRSVMLIGVLAAALLGAPAAPAAAQTGYVVIVNAKNPVATISAAEVSNLFLRKVSRWNGGGDVQPVDLPDGSAVRERFSEDVHGKAVAAIRAFWQRQIFSGRAVPPVEKGSEAEVLDYVQANVNAIGYVGASTRLEAGVKAVAITQ
jgi:ABC-type phosphate transport system substrate-binding protein